MKIKTIICTLVLILGVSSCLSADDAEVTTTDLAQEELLALAQEAYVYGYPLVVMDATKRLLINLPAPSATGYAPLNRFGHKSAFPDHTFTEVVKANNDTLYSSAWLDLHKEPIVLNVPDTTEATKFCNSQCMIN